MYAVVRRETQAESVTEVSWNQVEVHVEDFLPCRFFVGDEPVNAIAVQGLVDGSCYPTGYAVEVFGR